MKKRHRQDAAAAEIGKHSDAFASHRWRTHSEAGGMLPGVSPEQRMA